MIEVADGTLHVSGPMVIASAAELRTAGEVAIAKGAAAVDLSQVSDADSAAVALLLAWLRTAQEHGRTLTIAHAPDSVRSLATLYGVAELLPLV